MIDTPPELCSTGVAAAARCTPRACAQRYREFFSARQPDALRELLLSHHRRRVDAAMREYREGQCIRATWAPSRGCWSRSAP